MARKTTDDTAQQPPAPTRAELEGVLERLPGDYKDADYVVTGLHDYYGDLFTQADEDLVRERIKPPGTSAPATLADPAPTRAPGVIVPTIGRKVWFWREGIDRATTQPEDATVCYVHGDSMVNLRVTEHNGVSRSEIEVSLRQPNDPEWSGRHAEWMPFQKGQAAKS